MHTETDRTKDRFKNPFSAHDCYPILTKLLDCDPRILKHEKIHQKHQEDKILI